MVYGRIGDGGEECQQQQIEVGELTWLMRSGASAHQMRACRKISNWFVEFSECPPASNNTNRFTVIAGPVIDLDLG